MGIGATYTHNMAINNKVKIFVIFDKQGGLMKKT